MKNKKKLLSAGLILAFATPMFASADFDGNHERGDFKKGMAERMGFSHGKHDFQKCRFHRGGMMGKFQGLTLEEKIKKINSDENLTAEQKTAKIEKIKEKGAEKQKKQADNKEMINLVKESIQANPNISDDKKSDILEKIGSFFGNFFR